MQHVMWLSSSASIVLVRQPCRCELMAGPTILCWVVWCVELLQWIVGSEGSPQKDQ